MIKKIEILLLMLLLNSVVISAQEITQAIVKNDMKRVADWQIKHFNDHYEGKGRVHHKLDWTYGALYVGMVKWADMADNNTYYKWLKSVGEDNEWKLWKRKYHADDHTVGQFYCELYRKYNDEKMLKSTKEQFDFIMYHPSQSSLEWKTPFHQDRWNWCDALFMSPPVWAKLSKITGDKKYLDFMVSEFKASTEFLFDKKENLYYRDSRFFPQLENDKKVFWSRGNGWVFAGLTDIIDELDPKSKEYKYFVGVYKKMAKRLLELQTPEGHWAMSLLSPELYPSPETSGSLFYLYGMAWGINKGLLNKSKYEEAVFFGWNVMVSYVNEDGRLGYVQPVGYKPGEAIEDKTEVYGVGAFLSAGSEIYKMLNGKQM